MKDAQKLWPIYLIVISLVICLSLGTSKAVTTMAENHPIPHSVILIIDAGHGGLDGGATGNRGTRESQINLEIALRLEALAHILGYRTLMVRRTDVSVHTEGKTIAAQKASDLRQRAKLVNETDGAILLSIHQNMFSDPRYSGAQVFYSPTDDSDVLAESIRRALQTNRICKEGTHIYLLQHIQKPGVLIECGFLSNPQEEAMLRSEKYQKKLCCQIISGVSAYLQS